MNRLSVSLLCSLCLGALSACAPGPGVPRAPSLAALRSAAEDDPKDAASARAWALGELVLPGGDNNRAEHALIAARKLAPKSPELLFAQGLLADVHGHPSAALEAYLATVEQALATRDPASSVLVEVASYAILGQSGFARGFADRVRARLAPLVSRPELSLAARAALVDVLVPLAYRRGDAAEVANLGAQLGCVNNMRVAGPFGPRELLGFDDPPPLAADGTLPDRNDLGPGRGVRAARTVRAQGCRLNLGGGEVADGGMSLAQTDIDIPKAGDYTVRLDTPNSSELFVDGHSVLRVDRRKVLGARVILSKLTLQPGRHRVTLRMSSRHPNPVVELAFAGYRGSDADDVAQRPTSVGTAPFDAYLRVALSLARGDVLTAREALASASQPQDASALLLLQRAGIALADPLLPEGVRADEARRYLTRAATRDAVAWAPVVQLASLAAKAGQVKESLGVLRKAEKRWPEVPAIGLALAELLRSKNFQAAADSVLARVRQAVPDACAPMAAQLDALRSRQRYAEVLPLTQQLVQCDAQSNALYNLYLEQRDFTAAAHELQRLDALQPETGRYATLIAELSLAKNQNDATSSAKLVAELRKRFPRSYAAAVEQVDDLTARGRQADALAMIDNATKEEPASMAGLYRIAKALGQKHLLDDYRKDGLAAIKAFEASGKKYDGPQVLLLDYMAMRLFEDGSSLELIHTVQKAQSDEAVDRLAEVEIPEGAQVLTLRAIKPGGRTLEADNIAGKNTVSLPNFTPGDYVELEYVQAKPPADGFPGGYLGERFYFKSFEIPFHHSQMVLLLPEKTAYQLDPRGDAPQPKETVRDGVRILDFAVDESLSLVEEPNSVTAREFIPSTRLGVNATFPALVDSLRDVLADRNLYDPYYKSLVKQIVGDAGPKDYRLRAERLYTWTLENVENSNEVFAQAALMLRAKTGNRARVLHYLLGLADVPAQLALARSFASDAHDGTMADADTYDHLLVLVDGQGKAPLWLFANERWAPFGYLPTVLRSQPALLLDAGARTVKVDDGALGPDNRRFKVDAQLNADGSARLDITETLHGSEAVAWRGQLEQIPKAELSRRMEQDYAARLFPGAALVSLDIQGRGQADPDLVLRYVLDVRSFARPVADGLALPEILPSELSSTLARTASRKTTELMASPAQTELDLSLHLPKGYTLEHPPTPQTVVGSFQAQPKFVDSVTVADGTLRLQRSLLLPAMRVEPQVYPALVDFCRRVDETEGRELFLRAAH